MTEAVRKNPSELITRYELEPSLVDIYVEGEIDKSIIKWFLKEKGFNQVNVYPINSVSVDVQGSLPNNNKGRVITLCRYLNDKINSQFLHYLAIVDLDRDHVLGNSYHDDYLLITNFTSLELYLLNDECLKKFYSLSLRIEYKNIKEIFSLPLKQLFILQSINEALNLNFSSIPFTKLIEFSDDGVSFDFDEYLERIIHKNNLYDKRGKIREKYEEYSYLFTSVRLRTFKIIVSHCQPIG